MDSDSKDADNREHRDDRADQLMRQYTEIASLSGALAHEIRNPLSTIHLNLDLLVEDFGDAESQRDRRALAKLHVIRKECKHLQDILDAFLRYARVTDIELLPEDLNEVVKETLTSYGPKAAQHHIEIRPYLAADLPAIRLDRALLQQAVLNLLINAQGAMPEGGELTVQTYRQSDTVTLDVIDTGCGMNADTAAGAFRVFFSTKKDGSGLGLPTVKKIVEAHQGTIHVDSEEDKGTRFTISLPIREESAEDSS